MKTEIENQKKEFEAEKEKLKKEREREKEEQRKKFEEERELEKEEEHKKFEEEKEKLQKYFKFEKNILEKEVAKEKEKSRILENQLVQQMYAEFDEEIKIVEKEVIIDGVRVTFSEIINLKEVLTARIQRKLDNDTFVEDPFDKNKISLVFFGDDGGGTFKGGISIGNCDTPNSPDNFTVTVVVNGKLTKKIMEAVLGHMASQIEGIDVIIVKENGEDREFRAEWSLGGDYQWDLLSCGRKAAGCNCCCIWCRFNRKNAKIFKDPSALKRGEKRETFDELPDDEGEMAFRNITSK
uniref:Uncharacterized protein n=1 Tax=Panagrolaimus superbus TaxID=310955 RepID=A0A914YGM1_9BILA